MSTPSDSAAAEPSQTDGTATPTPSTTDPLAGKQYVDKETLLLVFSTIAAQAMTMHRLLEEIIPDGMVAVIPEAGVCQHKNRAPSYPAFCLDCEQEVGVSAESPGGDGS